MPGTDMQPFCCDNILDILNCVMPGTDMQPFCCDNILDILNCVELHCSWDIQDYRCISKSLSNRMIEKQVDIQLQQRKLRKLTLSDEILKQLAQEIFWSMETPVLYSGWIEINEDREYMDEEMEKIVEILRKQMQIRLLALQILKQRFLAVLKHSLNCQSGTSKSLDTWWLEFWEIVLLAAGDVESNPGPNQVSGEQLAKVDNGVLGIKDLPCVLDSVIDCQDKWLLLCLALYVPLGELKRIEKSHPNDLTTCLCEGLAVWLKGDYSEDQNGHPSWRMLVAAVDNSSGGNHTALALEIAKKQASDAFKSLSSPSPVVSAKVDGPALKKNREMSSAFSRLYRSLRRELRRVDVEEVKDVVRFSSNPLSLHERCVPLRVYEGATSTKDLLDQLYPTYINPQDTFLIEEIVENCGSRTCKKLLREYTNKFF